MGNTASAPEGRDPRPHRTISRPSLVDPSRSSPKPSVPVNSRSPYESMPQSPSGVDFEGSYLSLAEKFESASDLNFSHGAARKVVDAVDGLPSASGPSFPISLLSKASRATLTAPSQTSVAIDPKTIDIKSAVAILEQLKKTASPEDLVTLQRALLPTPLTDQRMPSNANFSATALTHPNSHASPSAATRKVSRTALIEGTPDKSDTWKPDMLRSSPLSKIERLSQQDISSNDSSESPRAQTPGDLEFSHLGALKLGTLVVTNGVPASPGPSVAETIRGYGPQKTDGKKEEEYFTADESGHECSDMEDWRGPSKRGRSKSTVFGPPLSFPYTDAGAERSTSNTTSNAQNRTRSGSPLKNQIRRDVSSKSNSSQGSLDREPAKQKQPSKMKSRKRLSKAVPVRRSTTRLNDLLLEDDAQPGEDPVLPGEHYFERNTSTLSAIELKDLADEYQAGLPDSPFVEAVVDPQSLPVLEQLSTEEPPSEDCQLQNTPLVMDRPEAPRESWPPWKKQITTKTALGSHPPDPVELPKQTDLTPQPSQSKSDSGYSSPASHYGSEHTEHDKSPRNSDSKSSNQSTDEQAQQESQRDPQYLRVSATHDTAVVNSSPVSQKLPDMNELGTPVSSKYSTVVQDTPDSKLSLPDPKSKSWMASRMRLSRLLSSDSGSSKSENPLKSESVDKPKEKAAKEARTAKKLQKKRPGSLQQVPSKNFSIPQIPSAMVSRLEERQGHNVLAFPYDALERPKTSTGVMVDESSLYRQNLDSVGNFPLHRPPPVKSLSDPLNTPVQEAPQQRPTNQRRLSLTRISQTIRPKSFIKTTPKSSNYDEDFDDTHYPREFASYNVVNHSLGFSPYDAAVSANQPRDSQPKQDSTRMYPGIPSGRPPPHGKRPGFRARPRPKSFHGRAARRMEVLGEEDMEDADSEDQPLRGRSLGGAAGDAHGASKAHVRPKSIGAPIHRNYDFAEHEKHPLPPVPNPADWAAHERSWRQRREGANRVAQVPPAQPRQASLGTLVVSNTTAALDLPGIGALPPQRYRQTRPNPPPRPLSEIVQHKSQPDLRGRFYKENSVPALPVGLAHRVSPVPRAAPILLKRREWPVAMAAQTQTWPHYALS